MEIDRPKPVAQGRPSKCDTIRVNWHEHSASRGISTSRTGLSVGAADAFLAGGSSPATDWSSKIQTLFTCLITLQFVVVVLHDLVDIPGWTHGAQVQSIVGRRRLWLITLVNAIFPGLAVAFAIYFWNRPKPGFVANYWMIYCAVTLASAIAMWYVPYFFGTTEERRRDYSRMYAGTLQVLPPRGDNPRPNLLHVCFHTLFVINFFLALALRFRSA